MKTKIAVTYENGEVFQHFGHTKEFKFYTVEDKKIVDSEIVPTMGSGHSMLADFSAAEWCNCAYLRRYRRRCKGCTGAEGHRTARRCERQCG